MEIETDHDTVSFADSIEAGDNELICEQTVGNWCQYYFKNEYAVTVTNCQCSQTGGSIIAYPDNDAVDYLVDSFESYAETIVDINDIGKPLNFNVDIIFSVPEHTQILDQLYDLNLNMVGYTVLVGDDCVNVMPIFNCSEISPSDDGDEEEQEEEGDEQEEEDFSSSLLMQEIPYTKPFQVTFHVQPKKMIINGQ